MHPGKKIAVVANPLKRIVIAEIDQKLVDAICFNNGSYWSQWTSCKI
jgi:hypothetical protein